MTVTTAGNSNSTNVKRLTRADVARLSSGRYVWADAKLCEALCVLVRFGAVSRAAGSGAGDPVCLHVSSHFGITRRASRRRKCQASIVNRRSSPRSTRYRQQRYRRRGISVAPIQADRLRRQRQRHRESCRDARHRSIRAATSWAEFAHLHAGHHLRDPPASPRHLRRPRQSRRIERVGLPKDGAGDRFFVDGIYNLMMRPAAAMTEPRSMPRDRVQTSRTSAASTSCFHCVADSLGRVDDRTSRRSIRRRRS